jgi:hypothetical protein
LHASSRNGDSLCGGLCDRLCLPHGRRRRRRAGRARATATRLQVNGEAFSLPKVRVYVDIVLSVGGRTRVELGRPLIQEAAGHVN